MLAQLCGEHRLILADVLEVFVYNWFVVARAMVLVGGYDYWITNADVLELGR